MAQNNNNEQLSLLALTKVRGVNAALLLQILEVAGSASQLFANIGNIHDMFPGASAKLIESLSDRSIFECAEKELEFTTSKGIRIISYNSDEYPYRLKECSDAPVVMYTMGNVNLDAVHVVSVVGTRRVTEYGKDICEAFVSDLARLLPDTLIVSGLAYGVDVCAHRAALKAGLPTIGVLAHGLDRIYPSAHRSVAKEMLQNGGVLTEYMSGTDPFKGNFLQRNRIVAGIADATVVVESPSYGGSLVTASLATGYSRDCFAFPGRINDKNSCGCNELIARNRAGLITSAYDFVEAMNWTPQNNSTPDEERELFPLLPPMEESVLELLRDHSDGLQINQIVIALDIPVGIIMSALFELEMKNLVRTVAGGIYRAIV